MNELQGVIRLVDQIMSQKTPEEQQGLLTFLFEKIKTVADVRNRGFKRIRGRVVGEISEQPEYGKRMSELFAGLSHTRFQELRQYIESKRFQVMALIQLSRRFPSDRGEHEFDSILQYVSTREHLGKVIRLITEEKPLSDFTQEAIQGAAPALRAPSGPSRLRRSRPHPHRPSQAVAPPPQEEAPAPPPLVVQPEPLPQPPVALVPSEEPPAPPPVAQPEPPPDEEINAKLTQALFQNVRSDEEKNRLSKSIESLLPNARTIEIAQVLNRYPHGPGAENHPEKRRAVVSLANEGIRSAALLTEELVDAVSKVVFENHGNVIAQFKGILAVNRPGIIHYFNQVTDSANKTGDVVEQLINATSDDARKTIVALANRDINSSAHLIALLPVVQNIKSRASCSFEEAATVAAKTQADFSLIQALESLLNEDFRQVKPTNVSTQLLEFIFSHEADLRGLRAHIACKLFQKGISRELVEKLLNMIRGNHDTAYLMESAHTLLFLIDILPLTCFQHNDFINQFNLFRTSFAVDGAARQQLYETLFHNVRDKDDADFLFSLFTFVRDPRKRNLGFAFRLNRHCYDRDDKHAADTCKIIAYSIEHDIGLNDNQCRQVAADLSSITDDLYKIPRVVYELSLAAGDHARTRAVIALAKEGITDRAHLRNEVIDVVMRMHAKGVAMGDAAVIAKRVALFPGYLAVLIALIDKLEAAWLRPQYMTIDLFHQIQSTSSIKQEQHAKLVQAMYAKGLSQSIIESFHFNFYEIRALIALENIVNELTQAELANLLDQENAALKALFENIYVGNAQGAPNLSLIQAKAKVLRACLENEIDLDKVNEFLGYVPNPTVEKYNVLSFMIRNLPPAACTASNLEELFSVAGSTQEERQRVRECLFSGVETKEYAFLVLHFFKSLLLIKRTESAALRIKENICKLTRAEVRSLPEEQKNRLFLVSWATADQRADFSDAKCSKLAKAFMKLNARKRNDDNLIFLYEIATNGGDDQKVELTIKLINKLRGQITSELIDAAYAMKQNGVDMSTAVNMTARYHQQINLDTAQVLATLISRDAHPLNEAKLTAITNLATDPNGTAILTILAHHLEGRDLYALSQTIEFKRLWDMANKERVLTTLFKDITSSQKKRSLLEWFIRINNTQNLNVDVAKALNRERNHPERVDKIIWMSQAVISTSNGVAKTVLASDISSEKLDVLADFNEAQVKYIRNFFLQLPEDKRTIEVLRAFSRYPDDYRQSSIVMYLAHYGVTIGSGLSTEIVSFLNTPQFVDANDVLAIPPILLQYFANITPPENRTLEVLQTLSRTSDEDLFKIVMLASGDHPDYSSQAMRRFNHNELELGDVKAIAALAKTGENYRRVLETLYEVTDPGRRTFKLIEKIAKLGGPSEEDEAKRAAIVKMVQLNLGDDQITDQLITIIAGISDANKQEEAIKAYRNAGPAKRTQALSFFARAHDPKPECFHSMLVELLPGSHQVAGYSVRQLCQSSTDDELQKVQMYFDIKRVETKKVRGAPPIVTEHELSDALPSEHNRGVSAVIMHLPDGGGSKVVISAVRPSELTLESKQYDLQTAREFGKSLTHVLGATKKRLSFKKEDLFNPDLKVAVNLGGDQTKKVPYVVLQILIAYKQGCHWFNIGDKVYNFLDDQRFSAERKCLKFLSEELKKSDGWTSDLRERLMEVAEDFVNNPDALSLRRL